jgi:hypothetical protein
LTNVILYCTAKLSISLRSPIYATACCCATTQEIKWTSRRLKSLLTVGATLWVISGVAVFVLPSQMNSLMYPLAMVIGAANALVMVSKTHTAEPAPTAEHATLAVHCLSEFPLRRLCVFWAGHDDRAGGRVGRGGP